MFWWLQLQQQALGSVQWIRPGVTRMCCYCRSGCFLCCLLCCLVKIKKIKVTYIEKKNKNAGIERKTEYFLFNSERNILRFWLFACKIVAQHSHATFWHARFGASRRNEGSRGGIASERPSGGRPAARPLIRNHRALAAALRSTYTARARTSYDDNSRYSRGDPCRRRSPNSKLAAAQTNHFYSRTEAVAEFIFSMVLFVLFFACLSVKTGCYFLKDIKLFIIFWYTRFVNVYSHFFRWCLHVWVI